jgi:hypothetical protein
MSAGADAELRELACWNTIPAAGHMAKGALTNLFWFSRRQRERKGCDRFAKTIDKADLDITAPL